MKKINLGFTLIELMIALAIVAILAGIAIPSFDRMLNKRGMITQLTLINGALSYARGEASNKLEDVVVCSSTDGQTCSGAVNWDEGWIIFVDVDSDRVPAFGTGNCGNNEDCLVRAQWTQAAMLRGISLRGNANWVAFNADGERLTGSATVFNLCGADALAGDNEMTRSLAINVAGGTSVALGAAVCP